MLRDNRWDGLDSDSEGSGLLDVYSSNRLASTAPPQAQAAQSSRQRIAYTSATPVRQNTDAERQNTDAESPMDYLRTAHEKEDCSAFLHNIASGGGGSDPKSCCGHDESDSDDSERICRYCFDGDESEGKLISPCKCKGGQKWVHQTCLEKWQRMCQVSKTARPWAYSQSAATHQHICNVCGHRFDVAAPVYSDLVKGLMGDEIMDRVKIGGALVASAESSEQSRMILIANGHIPELQRNLGPWIDGVYLIADILPAKHANQNLKHGPMSSHEGPEPFENKEDDVIVGVNLAKPMKTPTNSIRRHVGRIGKNRKVKFMYMQSGPCRGVLGLCLLKATTPEVIATERKVRIVRKTQDGEYLVVGNADDVVHLAHNDWYKASAQMLFKSSTNMLSVMATTDRRLVIICWGFAKWNRSQLNEEMALGGWGLANLKIEDVFEVEGRPAPVKAAELHHYMLRNNRTLFPEENELSRAANEPFESQPFEDTMSFEQRTQAQEHRAKLRAQLMKQQNSPLKRKQEGDGGYEPEQKRQKLSPTSSAVNSPVQSPPRPNRIVEYDEFKLPPVTGGASPLLFSGSGYNSSAGAATGSGSNTSSAGADSPVSRQSAMAIDDPWELEPVQAAMDIDVSPGPPPRNPARGSPPFQPTVRLATPPPYNLTNPSDLLRGINLDMRGLDVRGAPRLTGNLQPPRLTGNLQPPRFTGNLQPPGHASWAPQEGITHVTPAPSVSGETEFSQPEGNFMFQDEAYPLTRASYGQTGFRVEQAGRRSPPVQEAQQAVQGTHHHRVATRTPLEAQEPPPAKPKKKKKNRTANRRRRRQLQAQRMRELAEAGLAEVKESEENLPA